jgi:predicted histone-like DNA-binding protein
MGKLLIKKYQNNNENLPKCYKKWYGRLIHRGTLGTAELAEHIMKHGTVYTDDVVMGVTRKLMHCIAEQLADGYKVKLDGIGTLYLAISCIGADSAEEFDTSKNVKGMRVQFLADQSNSSIYKGSEVRKMVKLSTDLKPYGYAESDSDEDDGDDNGGGGAIEEQP